MARKKVVLFIVEGVTEKESLELLLGEVIKDNNEIVFEVANGDITSDNSIRTSNIKSKIKEIVNRRGKRKFKPTDYKEIIHLIDMDGAYISENNIFIDRSLDKFLYREDGIYANNKENVVKRNKEKQKKVNMLCSTSKVYSSVPYRVFYFSSNLEHVLHNLMNLEDDLKMRYAEEFQDKYIDDIDGFIKFICNSEFTVNKNYKESWDFIKLGNNSLKRYTNFNIVLNDYL